MDLLNIYLDEIKDVTDYPEKWFLDYVKELLTSDIYPVIQKILNDERYSCDDGHAEKNKPLLYCCDLLLGAIDGDSDLGNACYNILVNNTDKVMANKLFHYGGNDYSVFIPVLEKMIHKIIEM